MRCLFLVCILAWSHPAWSQATEPAESAAAPFVLALDEEAAGDDITRALEGLASAVRRRQGTAGRRDDFTIAVIAPSNQATQAAAA